MSPLMGKGPSYVEYKAIGDETLGPGPDSDEHMT